MRDNPDTPKREASQAITLNQVSYAYSTPAGPIHGLRNVTVNLDPAKLTAVVGPSGSGKSTLLKALSGLLPITQGSLRIAGRECTGMSTTQRTRLRRESIGTIAQQPDLVSLLTVIENVALGSPIERKPTKVQFIDHCHEQLERFGLQDLADRWPETLSGGQQQRVAIARVVAHRKPYLLADEPTGALDSTNAHTVFRALKGAALAGTTTVVVTHDPLVSEYADSTLNMYDGTLHVN